MLTTLVLNIKRRETPFYASVYKIAKAVRNVSFPCIRFIHLPLYYLHVSIANLYSKLYQFFWAVPLFKARCEECGPGLSLPCGIPLIMGSHLKLYIGSNVLIVDSTLAAGQLYDDPTIRIGDRTTIGYHTDISACQLIEIGNDVMIAKDCIICDNDGHSVSPERRLQHLPVLSNEVKPVKIHNNVWINTGSYIMKGVTIGENSIVAANSVVKQDVPANCMVAGSPAKVIKLV